MHKTVEAVYENGVFKPVSKFAMPEHIRVRLTIEDAGSVALATSGIIPAKNRTTIDEIAISSEFLPDEG